MNTGLTESELDSFVTDTEAALVLGCLDQLGKVTYRQALADYEKRLTRFLDFVDDISGK